MNKGIFSWATLISRIQSESPTVIIPHMGLENITVSEILKAKGEAEAGAVYWCSTSHSVHEAVQHVSINVFGEQQRIYLSTIVLQQSDQILNTVVETIDDSTQCWSSGGSQVREHEPACRNCNRERYAKISC
jgi:hypothetical protein